MIIARNDYSIPSISLRKRVVRISSVRSILFSLPLLCSTQRIALKHHYNEPREVGIQQRAITSLDGSVGDNDSWYSTCKQPCRRLKRPSEAASLVGNREGFPDHPLRTHYYQPQIRMHIRRQARRSGEKQKRKGEEERGRRKAKKGLQLSVRFKRADR